MTDEEMRRKMEFIVEQQAQFAVNIAQLREAQSNAEARLGRLEGAVVAVVDIVGRLTQSLERVTQGLERTNNTVAQLAEAQARTDERLNIFMTVVERYIGEGRNGKSQK
jgi:ABC-type transporter Mla subunit MlaD